MMRKINSLLFVFALLILSTCNSFDDLAIEPEVRTIPLESLELIEAFSTLTNGDTEACNLVYDPEDIPDILCNLIQDAERGSEIVFVVDKTTSMVEEIDQVKLNINKIIDCLPDGCRLGAATYGDKRSDGEWWFRSIDLSEDYDDAREFVNAITLEGGGFDLPESVYDALYEVLDIMSWKDCSAPDKIIVMGDAEPKTGSGTDYTAEEVLAKAQDLCDDTEFYPVIVLDLP